MQPSYYHNDSHLILHSVIQILTSLTTDPWNTTDSVVFTKQKQHMVSIAVSFALQHSDLFVRVTECDTFIFSKVRQTMSKPSVICDPILGSTICTTLSQWQSSTCLMNFSDTFLFLNEFRDLQIGYAHTVWYQIQLGNNSRELCSYFQWDCVETIY